MNYLIKREGVYLQPKPNEDVTRNWTDDFIYAGVFTEEELKHLNTHEWEGVEIIPMDQAMHVRLQHNLTALEVKKVSVLEKMMKCNRNV